MNFYRGEVFVKIWILQVNFGGEGCVGTEHERVIILRIAPSHESVDSRMITLFVKGIASHCAPFMVCLLFVLPRPLVKQVTLRTR